MLSAKSGFSIGVMLCLVVVAATAQASPVEGIYTGKIFTTEGLHRFDLGGADGTGEACSGPLNVTGMAYSPLDPNFGVPTFYTGDENGTRLSVVDAETGAVLATRPGSGGFLDGLAFDAANGILYGVTRPKDDFFQVDIATGERINSVDLGAPWDDLRGLAFDSTRNVAYAANVNGPVTDIIRIDNPNTAPSVTFIGTLADTMIEGLGYDAVNDLLYASDDNGAAGQTLLTIDPFSSHDPEGMISPLSAVQITPTMQPTFLSATGMTVVPNVVPEPSSVALLLIGGFLGLRRRTR